MEKSETIKSLAGALSKFQSEMEAITKDAARVKHRRGLRGCYAPPTEALDPGAYQRRCDMAQLVGTPPPTYIAYLSKLGAAKTRGGSMAEEKRGEDVKEIMPNVHMMAPITIKAPWMRPGYKEPLGIRVKGLLRKIWAGRLSE